MKALLNAGVHATGTVTELVAAVKAALNTLSPASATRKGGRS
jgi:hypothetical protein